MKQISSISRLAEHLDCESLRALGRHFYDKTECGVSTEYLTTKDSVFAHDDHHGITRDLPNIWAGHFVVGIRFYTIVEGSDAEFASDAIFFPCEYSEVEDALEYLENCVKELESEEALKIN